MKYPYKIISNEKIIDSKSPHPLEGMKDKTFFIEKLLKDLKIDSYEDISEGKKNLFRIYFNGLYYNIFIEFPDGGGKDISHNRTSKKISIPYGQKNFKKIINNYERIAVINIYFPLLKNKEVDYSKWVYLIIDPKEIYSSKVIKNNKKNPSSRWIKLEDIIDVMHGKNLEYNKNFKFNNKKNVFILNGNYIYSFFSEILQTKYQDMIYSNFPDINLSDLKNNNSKKYQKYRKSFRDNLITNRGFCCEIINCNISQIELMIASHIKPVKIIIEEKKLSHENKKKEIQDHNNGFLFCPNHDALFDKLLITFNINGKLIPSKIIVDKINSDFNLSDSEKVINIDNSNVIEYLKIHNKEFLGIKWKLNHTRK